MRIFEQNIALITSIFLKNVPKTENKKVSHLSPALGKLRQFGGLVETVKIILIYCLVLLLNTFLLRNTLISYLLLLHVLAETIEGSKR